MTPSEEQNGGWSAPQRRTNTWNNPSPNTNSNRNWTSNANRIGQDDYLSRHLTLTAIRIHIADAQSPSVLTGTRAFHNIAPERLGFAKGFISVRSQILLRHEDR